MGLEAMKISGGLIVISLIIYFIFSKKNNQKYALLHIIEKLRNKDLTSDTLEEELREIILERDNIVGDEFDEVIDRALVIDLDRTYRLSKLMQIVAEKFYERDNIKPKTMQYKFMEKELENSTVLIPTMAIPAVVVGGKNIFEIVLVRCKSGIKFSEKYTDVKTIIAIIGSKDNRNLYFQAFTAIAQIIKDEEFDNKWENAETIQNLRDIFILGERRRNN
jgi:mannitol/fructose-specific phosphotransferase system IIA component (Ntr-type)